MIFIWKHWISYGNRFLSRGIGITFSEIKLSSISPLNVAVRDKATDAKGNFYPCVFKTARR